MDGSCGLPTEPIDVYIMTGKNMRVLQVTLEPYERDHAVVCGIFRAQKK